MINTEDMTLEELIALRRRLADAELIEIALNDDDVNPRLMNLTATIASVDDDMRARIRPEFHGKIW